MHFESSMSVQTCRNFYNSIIDVDGYLCNQLTKVAGLVEASLSKHTFQMTKLSMLSLSKHAEASLSKHTFQMTKLSMLSLSKHAEASLSKHTGQFSRNLRLRDR